MDRYEHVFSPLKIGNIVVKNRIEVPPTLTTGGTPEGFVPRETIEYFGSLARGGAGIVTIGDSVIDYDYAKGHHHQLNLGDDRVIGGLSNIVEAVHRHGAKLSIELNHSGRRASPKVLNGRNPIAPSPIPSTMEEIAAVKEGRPKVVPTGMDQSLINQVVNNFASAAYRCLIAGFEMIMLHGGHGHLLSSFVSPYCNKRTDGYGGSLENRAKFVIEVLTAIRKKVGNRLAIEYRVSADELVPGGMHLDDTIEFLKLIQDKIDLVNVSLGGTLFDPRFAYYTIQPTYLPHALNADRAEKIKKSLRIPVTCVGSITDMDMAENLIAQGKADIVAMARAVIADPEIVNKAYRGEIDEIRPCLRCSVCSDRGERFMPVRCAVNPVIGRELDYNYIRPAAVKKKVLIIGGGPAGMEAAMVASSRGHQVTLLEKEKELGGALRYAAAPAFKEDMKNFLSWMIKKTLRSPIKIKLSTEADADSIRSVKPDVLIVAVGAVPVVADIPGIKNSNVVWAGDVDLDRVKTGQTVVVAGAGLTGCETALHIARQGKKVTVIDMVPEAEIAEDTPRVNRLGLLALLGESGVQFRNEVKLQEITKKSVVVIDKNWNRMELPADTVVLSLGFTAPCENVKKYERLAREVYVVGDCLNPRNIMGAIHDAFNIAVEI